MKRWQGYVWAGLRSREILEFRVPTSSNDAEGHVCGGVVASRCGTLRGQRAWARTEISMRENREVPLPPAELAVHPTDGEPHDELHLMADDLYATVAELQDRGVKFTRPITDAGWGLLTALELPDGRELALYEPRHPRPLGPSG